MKQLFFLVGISALCCQVYSFDPILDAWLEYPVGQTPLEIIDDPVFSFCHKGIHYTCNPDDISNLYEKCGGKLMSFINLLLEEQRSWKKI